MLCIYQTTSGPSVKQPMKSIINTKIYHIKRRNTDLFETGCQKDIIIL